MHTFAPHKENVAASGPSTEAETIFTLQKTVSPSRLITFLQCRLKFYFRHVLKLPKPKSTSLHVGNTVHAVLQAWHKARWMDRPLTLKELHTTFQKVWTDQLTDEPVGWQDDDPEAEKLTAWRLCETYLREWKCPDTKPDAVEVSVEADLPGLPRLIGILDLVQQGRIIDYKTSASTPNPEKAVHTHEVQTTSYAVLYREATGLREQGVELHHLVKLKNPRLCITSIPPMSSDQQTRLFRLMESYVDGLDRRDFIPSPGMGCTGCEFFNECRSWK